jgi:hypothetical protein
MPTEQFFGNVWDLGDARSKNKYAGAQRAGIGCPFTGATTTCED